MKHIIISVLILMTGLSQYVYAEGAGIRINYNKLKIHVEYNDNAFDKITGVEYIREPSGLLFDLIKIIQENSTIADQSNRNISVSIDNYGGSLWIYQETKPSYVALHEKNIKHLDKKLLLTTFCKILSIENCNTGDKKSQTWFYISDSNVSSDSADLIEFGCFPCNNIINYTLTPRFQSSDPNVPTPKFKKVTVDRQTIYHYFNNLIE